MTPIMIKRFALFIFGLLISINCFAQSGATVLDYIAAKVNDQIISYNQLQQRAKLFSAQLRAENVKLPPQKLFLQQVLQTMINEELQLELAQRGGINVTNYDVQQA